MTMPWTVLAIVIVALWIVVALVWWRMHRSVTHRTATAVPDIPLIPTTTRLRTTLRLDVPNSSGRVYPRAVIARAIAEAEARGPVLGVIGDATTGVLKAAAFVCHDIAIEGDRVAATLEVLQTPNGALAQTLLAGSGTLALALRGFGEVSEPDAQGIQQVTTFSLTHCALVVGDRGTLPLPREETAGKAPMRPTAGHL